MEEEVKVELPEPAMLQSESEHDGDGGPLVSYYTADQMRQAILAERERALEIVRKWHTLRDASGRLSPVGEELTSAIRKG